MNHKCENKVCNLFSEGKYARESGRASPENEGGM